MPPKTRTTERILDVFEAVMLSGPISLNELSANTGIPRSSAHRAAQILENKGWIRPRLFDHAYQVTSLFSREFVSVETAHRLAERIGPSLKTFATEFDLDAEIGVFSDIGVFDTLDKTERSSDLDTHQSLVMSPLALMAQLILPPELLVRHLDAYLSFANTGERHEITTGQHRITLAELRKDGPMAISPYFAFPFHDREQHFGTIVFKQKPSVRAQEHVLAGIGPKFGATLVHLGLTTYPFGQNN
ncbi:hypothetical protein GCM10008927_30000 [Amylibacter ulvae]|uniref:HTH iclR-type domain-containing protein n=1 Tax=Paramylibacter ulvae TaxID=1651968 RepID=A0ABQ3D794_9RHOB|nr:helix-turn-helix domain-containing protein [Amylibacter ulvae]GHA62577.1 hypothetical protein GCM10008927_30000 [Amylibacter ulvae]